MTTSETSSEISSGIGGKRFQGRVLYVARAPFFSGAEQALLSMLRHLDRDQVTPELVVGHETELVDRVQKLDIPVHLIKLVNRTATSVFRWRRSLRQMHQRVMAFDPDVIHANDVPSAAAASITGAKYGIGRVVHVRWGMTAVEAGWFVRRGSESLICISRWIRDRLCNPSRTPLADTKIEILADAVDWPLQGEPQRSSLTLSEPTIGFAGQIIPDKGLDLIIEAMARMSPSMRPKLLIAGQDTQNDGKYREKLIQTAKHYGLSDRIRWLGFLDDMTQLYEQVTAMVCPSRREPLGLVPLEAAGFSIPTLANRVGGLAETIQDNKTGWLIEPTTDAWAQALEEIHNQKKVDRFGRSAGEWTRKFFSPLNYQDRLMAIYKQCQIQRVGCDR